MSFGPKVFSSLVSDEKLMDQYLSQVEKILKGVSPSLRVNLILEIKNEILSRKQELGVPLRMAIKRFNGPRNHVNAHLQKQNLPRLKRKLSWAQMFILFLLSLFVTFFLIVYFFIRSLTPFVKVDDIQGTLELFGGRFVMERDDSTFFTRVYDDDYNLWKKTANSFEGSIQLDQGVEDQTIEVHSKQGDLAFRVHDEKEIRYTCLVGERPNPFVTTEGSGLVKLSLSSRSYCLFHFPKRVKLSADLTNGHLSLKDLDNQITAKVAKGSIAWVQTDKSLYQLEDDSKHMKGTDLEFKTQGTYGAALSVQEGFIRLR